MADENYRAVYEQYWLHARHCENNIWAFTRYSTFVIAAVFAAQGFEKISLEIKVGVSLFGAALSIVGFFAVYVHRVPFLRFALLSELIAINELKMGDKYRRFFPKNGKAYPQDKVIDIDDELAFFFSSMAAIMVYLLMLHSGISSGCLLYLIPALVLISLIIFHRIIRQKVYLEISKDLEKQIEPPVNRN